MRKLWRTWEKNGDVQAVLMYATTAAGNLVLIYLVVVVYEYFKG